jgi:hypothetical protein
MSAYKPKTFAKSSIPASKAMNSIIEPGDSIHVTTIPDTEGCSITINVDTREHEITVSSTRWVTVDIAIPIQWSNTRCGKQTKVPEWFVHDIFDLKQKYKFDKDTQVIKEDGYYGSVFIPTPPGAIRLTNISNIPLSISGIATSSC